MSGFCGSSHDDDEDDLRARISYLETALSSMVSLRDLTIRDLRAALAIEQAMTDELIAALNDVSLDEGYWSAGWQRVATAQEAIKKIRSNKK